MHFFVSESLRLYNEFGVVINPVLVVLQSTGGSGNSRLDLIAEMNNESLLYTRPPRILDWK